MLFPVIDTRLRAPIFARKVASGSPASSILNPQFAVKPATRSIGSRSAGAPGTRTHRRPYVQVVRTASCVFIAYGTLAEDCPGCLEASKFPLDPVDDDAAVRP